MAQLRACPAIFLSAPASHQGKTTITAGLASHFRKSGKNVRVFKAGPDFLDPMILQHASGNPVYQLDLFMMGESDCRRLVYEAAASADVIIVEGVMGLFDGQPSSADLAQLLDIPVALVIDASGMAQTFSAIVHGLATYRGSLNCIGAIANNVGSARHVEMLHDDGNKIPLLAAFAREDAAKIPSRHLGLLQVLELDNIDVVLNHFAALIAGTDLGKLPQAVSFEATVKSEVPAKQLDGKTIAIAKDRAFSFIYQHNLDWLEQMGAKVVFFSPIADINLPEADALYLPGGYPELHLHALSNNHSMKRSITLFHQSNKPIYAECGGMLYLLESIKPVDGNSAEMTGLIRGGATMQLQLSALGYQSINFGQEQGRGHTFHYSKLEPLAKPDCHAVRRSDGSAGEPVYRIGSLFASYVHLYFPSAPNAMAAIFNGQMIGLSPAATATSETLTG